MSETHLEKVWQTHTVRVLPSGQTQRFIGLHLTHEVSSPQAIQMLREAGLRVRFPERTLPATIPDGARSQLLPSVICEGIGQRWESRDVSFKPYPTAHVTHSFIDAALHLRRTAALTSDEILGIMCPVAAYMVPLVCEPAGEKRAPRSAASARVSLPHILAEALVFGEIGPRSFSEERRSDPRVRGLAERTESRPDPEAPGRERYKGWVQIRLRDGRVLEHIEEHNRGSPQRPLDEAALREKFRGTWKT